ncbi:MAG: transglycosylase domain-containing protein [Actinomycetota bacterium]|nr:transglycosylase domain-containing protein [Actinomycetota bacterium]
MRAKIPLVKYAIAFLVGSALLGVTSILVVFAIQNFSVLKERGTLSTPLKLRPLTVPSKIVDAKGNLIYRVQNGEYRSPVALSAVPPVLKHAILDVEDHTFYVHGPLDLRSIMRALVSDFQGNGLQGGSTITQQLVKNAILTPQRTLSRKFQEAILSYRLFGQMTRNQILGRYLNTIYFGEGAYGVQAAAETFFNEPLAKLDIAQSALLAAMIENPAGYDPFYFPQAALFRRNLAIKQMQEYGSITKAEAVKAMAEPLPKTPYRQSTPPPTAFATAVVDQLLNSPQFSFLGGDPSQRLGALQSNGYVIHTTLNPQDQAYADAAVARIMPNTGGKFTSALVSMDPTNGNVLAIVSGNPTKDSAGFDVATGLGSTGRQPGSSFKIFTLATLLEQGYSPNDIIDGTGPCKFTVPGTQPFPYIAHNAEPGYGLMTITDATANSVNCAYIRLGVKVGLQNVINTAKVMGITTPLTPVPSVVIGSEDVTPLEMATAYSVLANGGYLHPARFITSIDDFKGTKVFNPPVQSRQVLSPRVVAVEDAILRQVIIRGTGTAAALYGRPAAGKTGTTDQFTDGWFDGFTPQMVTTVWMGAPAGSIPMYDVGGIPVYGGTYPAEIWHAYMSQALAGQPVLPFPTVNPGWIPPSKFIVPIDAPGSIMAPTTSAPPTTSTTSTTSPTSTTTAGGSTTTAPSATTTAGPSTTPASTPASTP